MKNKNLLHKLTYLSLSLLVYIALAVPPVNAAKSTEYSSFVNACIAKCHSTTNATEFKQCRKTKANPQGTVKHSGIKTDAVIKANCKEKYNKKLLM